MRDWPIPPFFFCFASKVKDTNVAVMFSHELLMERVATAQQICFLGVAFFSSTQTVYTAAVQRTS